MNTGRRIAVGAVVALGAALAFAGCAIVAERGGGMGNGMDHDGMGQTDGSSEFNRADIMFAQMMIPHHEQAIEMSDVILAKDGIDQRVTELAQQIKDAQAPEIELMEDCLDAEGLSPSGDMNGMDHGDGMMSQDDMDALQEAEGADAARLFLEQMIEHHEGAVEMAQDELETGEDPEIRDLAEQIIDSQTAEIALMRELLTEV